MSGVSTSSASAQDHSAPLPDERSRPHSLIVMYPHAAAEVYGYATVVAIAHHTVLLAPALSAEALAERPELLAQAEVIFSGWGAPVMDEAFLAKAPRLQAVFYAAGTIRGWATDALWKRNIAVTTAASANAIPVAEYTFSTLLFSLKAGWRHIFQSRTNGRHTEPERCAGAFRSKVGIISLGTIARLVIERLRSTDVEILAYDPYVAPETAARLGVTLVPLETLFSECDAVSLHAPLLPATRGIIGREHFSIMKPGATFINTARGEIVREAELIEVLTAREDVTAVLDVTFPEPPVPDSPLYRLPNVVLTPHIAGSMAGERLRLGHAMLEEFSRWQKGAPLHWQVTREAAMLMA